MAVYRAIRAAGRDGRTDDELQVELNLRSNSENPRRVELWTSGAIEIRRDADGQPVRRRTRANRSAVVWVVVTVE